MSALREGGEGAEHQALLLDMEGLMLNSESVYRGARE
jgi:hypothetical protein